MDTNRATMKVITNAMFLPQHVGFVNTIFVNLYDEIKEFVEDQNGMVTQLGSYLAPHVSPIKLKPRCFSPRHISQLLHQFIVETQFCQDLGEKIALDCAYLSGPFPFVMFVDVKFTREVRIMLPAVTVPSKAASEYVLQRLVEEQRVESIDLENKTTCSICMEDLSETSSSENSIMMPNCLHLFRQSCIFEWLKRQNSCPLCRRVPYEDSHETE